MTNQKKLGISQVILIYFLLLSGEEAGTVAFYRKFFVQIQVSAGNKIY